jgi:hypothetical protein
MSRGMARQQVLWERLAARQVLEKEEEEAEAAREAARAATRAEKVYVVEAIVNRRVVDSVIEYRVRWEGFASARNTWENQETLLGARKLIAL